jgi:hypothetical protein
MLGEALQQWADATRLWQLGDACGTRSDQMADARQQQHQAEARLLALVQDAPRSDAPRRSLP